MERDSKKIVRHLLDDGFVLVSIKGSHHKFARNEGGFTRTVMVPHPKKDIPTGTARYCSASGWIR